VLAVAKSKPRTLELGKDILLARFARHYCDGRYLIKARSEVTVKDKKIDKKRASAPRNILIPEEIHEVLSRGFRPIDRLIDDLEPYPLVGLKGLTETTLEHFVPRWDDAQKELAAARQEVRDRWGGEVETWNREYWEEILGPDYEDSVGRRLRRIRYNLDILYSVDYDLWKPPEPVDVAMGSPVVQRWLTEGRANAEKAVEEALLAFVTGPRDALVQAADGLLATLQDPNTQIIKVGTFNAMRTAMTKLRALKEISDVALIEQINRMDAQLDEVIGDAENSGIGFTSTIKSKAGELVASIESVIQAAKDKGATEDILHAFGKAGRAIELD
jgi:hypothetical protein